MKHTPGPWHHNSFALREEIMSENNPLIATVCSVHCDSPEEMRDNARLIAAAPELLAALEGLFDEYEDRRAQFCEDPLWKKWERVEVFEEAGRLLDELKGETA